MLTSPVRLKLQEHLAKQPLPNVKNEPWRFFPLQASDFSLDISQRQTDLAAPNLFADETALGWINWQNKNALWKKTAESTLSLADINSTDWPTWADTSYWDSDFAAQYAIAHASQGFIVEAKNSKSENLRLRYDASQTKQAHHSAIYIGTGAVLNLTEEFVGQGAEQFLYGVTEVFLAKGATLRLVQIFDSPDTLLGLHRLRVRVEAEANLEIHTMQIGGKRSQVRQDINIMGSDANIKMVSTTRGFGSQQYDYWCTLNHFAPGSTSGLDCYYVMDDSSRANFNGMIKIAKKAKLTDSYQKHKSLLLSKNASVFTMPKLEIAVDDVKCAHGASISTINPDQMFYLESRGMANADARRMIVDGFLEPALLGIASESLRENIRERVLARVYGSEK